MSSGPRFNQGRKDWATSSDALAEQCYQEHYEVTAEDIYPVETLVDHVHDREEGYRTHQIIDYGGTDRILDCGVRHLYVSERIRPADKRHRDLSLRTDNGVDGRYPELTKWLTGFNTNGFYPDVIAFGIYEGVLEIFQEFHLLDTAAILGAVSEDLFPETTVTPDGDPVVDALDGYYHGSFGEKHPTGDGTEALYLTLDELQEMDAIVETWEGVGLPSDA